MAYQQVVVGGAIGFSAILLAQLRYPQSPIKINSDEASWIASLTTLPCPIGSLIIGYLTDTIGRKNALQFSYIPLILSMTVLCFANSLTAIYAARILAGLSLGTGGPIYAYIAETSPTKWRPLFSSLFSFYVGLGMTLAAILGIFFHWQMIAGIFSILSVIGLIMPFAIPETSAYLKSRGLDKEAQLSEDWFGFKLPFPHEEEPIIPVEEQKNVNKPFWKRLTRSAVWKPLLVSLAFFVCQQGSGFYVVLFYSVDVLKDCRVPVDGMTANVFLSGARTAGSIFNLMLQSVPKKTLTILSGSGMCLMLSTILIYLHVFTDMVDPPYSGLLIYAFVLYVFFAMFAVLPLPWSICGEIFPMSVKGTMTGLLYSIGYELMFFSIKVYPSLVAMMGIEWVWTIFTGFCLATALFGAFILPETTGKSLEEILDNFKCQPKSAKKPLPI
ncbi:facilitated trehalose transporter Tret1-like isoform X2 [Daktulosphaira vitifoliae]|nr:facilitated trehalose transporter Tret1-like isoform X2 [Daktulosphaira vitifoliae]